ncbi:hypothetical protein Tco_0287044 [Tanacetum coccineum]
MIMSLLEEMYNQVAKCNAVNQENKTVNESLIAELERYKEMVNFFEERQKFDLNDREKYIDSQMQVKKHDALSVIDSEETLDLAETTRLKMNEKQNDPIVKEKRVNIKPIDYSSLNDLYKHFVSQKQLSNFELGLYREVYEMKAIFQQMETEVEQCSVDRKYFEIEKKELLIETKRLLEQIILKILCVLLCILIMILLNMLKWNKVILMNTVGKSVSDCIVPVNTSNLIAPVMFKLNLPLLSPKLRKNREAHVNYLKQTKEHADTLRDIVEQARALKPLDNL